MKISIIKTGNSKSIIFPKDLLEKYNIKDKVELILEKEFIILKPVPIPRKGWEESFKEMNEKGDDKLLFDDVFDEEN